MGIRLLKGRLFNEHDSAGGPDVVILNELLAQQLFQHNDALGHHVSSGGPWLEVVGVVSDTRNLALDQQSIPEIFVPYPQRPSFVMTLVIRTRNNPQDLAGSIRNSVLSLDKSQPLSEMQTMEDLLAKSTAPQRFRMFVVGLFALLALVLAAIGIYGVINTP
jgi:hypothetical protein